jgi:hypothetical protein
LDYIENAIHKDMKFRNSLKGIMIGQFTIQEHKKYVENSIIEKWNKDHTLYTRINDTDIEDIRHMENNKKQVFTLLSRICNKNKPMILQKREDFNL